MDFYDDSIVDFDQWVGYLIDQLKEREEFDNSILIIGSDHGQEYIITHKIPLIIHFPNNDYAGKITSNVQNIDIAPTILDYINIEPPIWMECKSILSSNLGNRPIFSYRIGVVRSEGQIIGYVNKPPFFQFGYINVVYCEKYYQFNLVDFSWVSGNILGHTSPCGETQQIPDSQIFLWVKQHLKDRGFDVSSLNDFSIVKR